MSGCEPVRDKPCVWRDEDDEAWVVDQIVQCNTCRNVWQDHLAECSSWDGAMWAARLAVEAQAFGGATGPHS